MEHLVILHGDDRAIQCLQKIEDHERTLRGLPRIPSYFVKLLLKETPHVSQLQQQQLLQQHQQQHQQQLQQHQHELQQTRTYLHTSSDKDEEKVDDEEVDEKADEKVDDEENMVHLPYQQHQPVSEHKRLLYKRGGFKHRSSINPNVTRGFGGV
ncbi:hypothetical protein SAMD00019534_047770 [Acytostelium subglobosum LB1]|uniref:hypothetical protein n=1 Tax=Acytostelium subglobosum LB1 TaxID=1410327 RepID=UPI000644A448|nr:hypothetical protein SAMD00019534_047770 [Acytostelium subglobosum LB1]GAM21602.1 hypothetical protein SAMD00019534_047770 [Acytostelium subglobosum LB1]|eukprot:XP_012755721.1 hypothetical protein SAMD00019534_047770 [Acytostelium subglobosum LB1]